MLDETSDILDIFTELAPPVLSVYEMRASPSTALLAADGGIVMNACHLIFHMNSLW